MITRHQPAPVPTNSPNTSTEQQQPALQQAAGSDLQQMLSSNAASRSANTSQLVINGVRYQACLACSKVYHARNNKETHTGSLVDGGCNGGIAWIQCPHTGNHPCYRQCYRCWRKSAEEPTNSYSGRCDQHTKGANSRDVSTICQLHTRKDNTFVQSNP